MSANTTPSGGPHEGSNYTLTCAVRGDELLVAANRTFRWDRVDGMNEYSIANDTLTFNPLSRGDAGEYRCTGSFDSPYLIGTHYVITSLNITVTSKCKFGDH